MSANGLVHAAHLVPWCLKKPSVGSTSQLDLQVKQPFFFTSGGKWALHKPYPYCLYHGEDEPSVLGTWNEMFGERNDGFQVQNPFFPLIFRWTMLNFRGLAILCELFGMVKWPFKRLSDLQLGNQKVTLNHLGCMFFATHFLLMFPGPQGSNRSPSENGFMEPK